MSFVIKVGQLLRLVLTTYTVQFIAMVPIGHNCTLHVDILRISASTYMGKAGKS